ncbi:amidase signature enzyme [Cadophora sp. DSE1049]|nr:amidase signature enzyme [Cadophora sp. DSE1049]
MLATGAITSQEVCSAFRKRAAIAHQVTNCGTEIFFDKALERAKFLVDYLAREQKPFGRFHGLPISIKDSFNVKGLASTLGYVKLLKNPVATENSILVDILLDNGAVLYMKTNVPQTLMTCDSINNVFGRTLNPHKLSLTAGGSSGGEGALVGFRGSLLGVGANVGGSIRIPALSCGVYGFKPTADRVPYGKQEEGSRPGDPGMVSVAGPLATSAADLSFFFRNVLKSEPWKRDATALAVP